MPEFPLGSVDDLLKRFKKAQARWNLWRSVFQEAYDFAAPERETFRFRSPGQRKNRHVFASTAIIGLQQFASQLQANLVPSWLQWMKLAPGNSVPKEEEEEVQKGLEESTDTFFTHLNFSNFSTEIAPAFIDLGMGTGAILFEEGAFDNDEAFVFSNVPLAELYLEAPIKGKIENAWRQEDIEVGLIQQTWPDAVLPSQLESMAKSKPHTEVKILTGMLLDPKSRRYWHCIIHEASKSMLFSQSFKTKRLIVFRWHVTPGEAYGRGPILQMMGDIRTENKVRQFALENAAIQIAGLYTGVDDGVFNPHTVRIAPGTIIPVSSNNSSNPSLAALPRAGDLGLSELLDEKLSSGIKKALFADPLGEVTDPVKSATEQLLRNQERLRNEGASLGRMKTELIEQLVATGVDILAERGLITAMVVDGRDVTLKQTSPLAKAEALEEFQSSQVWMNAVAQLGAILGPEIGPALVTGSVKVEELPGRWAEWLGVPADLSRTEDEKKELATQLAGAVKGAAEQGGTNGEGSV